MRGWTNSIRSHFGSSHFLFERARCFSRSRAFPVLSCPSVYNPVCSFPSFLMARVGDGSNVPIAPLPASSSKIGFPHGSFPDLEKTGFRASAMEEKINEIYLQLPLFMQNAARIENCVAAQTTKITNIEQIVSSLVARVTSLERNAASGSSSPDSARSRNMLGQSNGSTATGSLGPTALGHPMTIVIQDVDLILLQALKTNMHGVPSYYDSHVSNTTLELRIGSITFGKNQTFQSIRNPSDFISKQVLCRPDSYSKQEPNVRTLWPDKKMMVSPMKLTVPSAAPKQLSRSANPNHLKTWRFQSSLRHCGVCWPNNSKFSSLMEMTKVHLSSQRSTPAPKFSALSIEETMLENLCSNSPLLEVDSCLLLLHLTCVFLVFLVKCCNRSSLKPARPMCDGRPFASPLFRRLAGRGALFRGFPFRWGLHLVIFDSQHNRARCHAFLQGGSSI